MKHCGEHIDTLNDVAEHDVMPLLLMVAKDYDPSRLARIEW